MTSDPSEIFVTLRSGLVLPTAALRLGLDLERRGWTLRRVGDKLSVTRPTTDSGVDGAPVYDPDRNPDNRDTLTDLDKDEIRKYRNHLLVVVDLPDPLLKVAAKPDMRSGQRSGQIDPDKPDKPDTR